MCILPCQSELLKIRSLYIVTVFSLFNILLSQFVLVQHTQQLPVYRAVINNCFCDLLRSTYWFAKQQKSKWNIHVSLFCSSFKWFKLLKTLTLFNFYLLDHRVSLRCRCSWSSSTPLSIALSTWPRSWSGVCRRAAARPSIRSGWRTTACWSAWQRLTWRPHWRPWGGWQRSRWRRLFRVYVFFFQFNASY